MSLALARDERYVYAGHSWGVGVYGLDGAAVTRVPLGESVAALAVSQGQVWAGTRRGLFRIDCSTWQVAHLWLHGDVPERDRYSHSFPGREAYWFDNQVYTLVPDGEDLWIGLHRNVQRLNTRTLALRAYSFRELQTESWLGVQYLVPDGPYVWAAGYESVRRYDRASDTWDTVRYGKRPVGLIGVIDGLVLGDVYLDDQLRHRPCLIDRQTLKVTPLRIDAAAGESGQLVNSRFSYYGRYQDRIVLGPGGPAYTVDAAAGKIVPLPRVRRGNHAATGHDPVRTVPPRRTAVEQHRPVGAWCRKPEGRNPFPPRAPPTVVVRDRDSGGWTLLVSADGLRVAGRRYEPNPDPLAAMAHEKRTDVGGLRFFVPGRAEVRVSLARICRQPGRRCRFRHRRRSRDPAEMALHRLRAGRAGPEADRVVTRLSREDGLPANRITCGAAVGRQLYFGAAGAITGPR